MVKWLFGLLQAAGEEVGEGGEQEAHDVVAETAGPKEADQYEEGEKYFQYAVGGAGAGEAFDEIDGAGLLVDPEGVFDPENSEDGHGEAGKETG